MIQIIILWSVICLLIGCGKDNTAFEEREFVSLEGAWTTALGQIHLPGSVDESRLAPRNSDTLTTGRLTRLHPYEGSITYSREVEIPASSAHKEWRLIMERTKPSTLWIDGDSVGSSSLILSPQVYTLGRLSPGKHMLSIRIDNSPASVPTGIHGSHAWSDATQTNWNGIIGRFGLEANEGLLIEALQLYPDITSRTAQVKALICSPESGEAQLIVRGDAWNTDRRGSIPEQRVTLNLVKGNNSCNFKIDTGKEQLLWSEFDPALYKVHFELSFRDRKDVYTLDIGLRHFTTEGTQFRINSLKTFLRGKNDAAVFPLTGYPPMEKEEWKRQMRIAKEYGINHYRFHSWTPPQAAFEAANEEGIYIQAELPYWGTMDAANHSLNRFLIQEGEELLNVYGNNPSFVMMALGNELGGDIDCMRWLVERFRGGDNRRLYAYGSNNFLGTAGPQSGEDYFVACRVGGQVGSDDYSMHARSTFSFADAMEGGYLNGTYPSTERTFNKAVEASGVPVISHENGQFQVYPDYDEIRKYKGVLYPYNMEIFRQRLLEKGMADQASDFHRATGRFAALCYKADIEMCLRTPGFGGFQLLDLQDYPGQGSAYVGLLDAFMDSKGAITPEAFREFSDRIVPLAVMPRYCWSNGDTLTARLLISNWSAEPIRGEEIRWSLRDGDSEGVLASGTIYGVEVAQGSLTEVGRINASLQSVDRAVQLLLVLEAGSHINRYPLWVYPEKEEPTYPEIEQTTSLQHALALLKQGRKVLYSPDHAAIAGNSVGGSFTPDYWNYAMFKGISESVGREVSPGTLSILTNPAHPLFREFPTEMHSNWQWWIILKHARPLILDRTPHEYKPLIQVIDNIERNHKLGLLLEVRSGEGKLLVNLCDLEAIADKPEGRQYRRALLQYMVSPDFNPETVLSEDELTNLFTTTVEGKVITGEKNITSYQ